MSDAANLVGTWAEIAACRGLGHVMFPRERTGRGGSANWGPARKLCAACPATDDCLAHAMATGELDFGMWGGLTPQERRAIAGRSTRRPPTIAARISTADARREALGISARALSVAVDCDRGWWASVQHRRSTSAELIARVEAHLGALEVDDGLANVIRSPSAAASTAADRSPPPPPRR